MTLSATFLRALVVSATKSTRKEEPTTSSNQPNLQTMNPPRASTRLRVVAVIISCILLLCVFAWVFSHEGEKATDQTWISLLVLAMLFAGTATSWFRVRHMSSMRPWLQRHIIGNGILALGLFAAWFYDVGTFYLGLIALAVFVMWLWGNRKLREAVLRNK
jgi:peptidoglycan/LPS O-acetylase OafA/YrhL